MEKEKIQTVNRSILLMNIDLFFILYSWRKDPHKDILTIMKKFLIEQRGFSKDITNSELSDILNNYISYFQTNLSKQAIVLRYEYLKRNIKANLPVENNFFKKIKFKIEIDGSLKTVNALYLLDIIREAFAHNSDKMETPNWIIESKNYILIIKDKVKIKLKPQDLSDLLYIYEKNALEKGHNSYHLSAWLGKLEKAINKKRLTAGGIHKYIEQIDENTQKVIEMDKYQKITLFRYFNDLIFDEIKIGFNTLDLNYVTRTIFPSKNNDNMLFLDTTLLLYLMYYLNKYHTSYDSFAGNVFNKMIYSNEEPYSDSNRILVKTLLFTFGRSNKFEAIILSSILFNVFTFVPIDDLKKYFNEDINIKKLRNSIIHGRYYYNLNNGFEFYDGQNPLSLSHITTINLDKIFELLQLIVADYSPDKHINL